MPDPKIFISIVICTHNRCGLLNDALQSFLEATGRESISHEFIVIDNKSTDDTKAIVDRYADQFNLRYVYEDKIGVSHARNRGIIEAVGEYIAFADDDVLFSKQWLVELAEGISRWPDVFLFAGKALPKWEIMKPKWYIESRPFGMRSIIGHFEPNITEGYLDTPPYACNMIVKKEVFERIGKFDVRLGRIGKKLFSAEEFDFFKKIQKNDLLAIYLPNVIVQHRVVGKRNKISYYIKWKYNSDKSLAIVNILHTPNMKKFLFIRINGLKELVKTIRNIFSDIFIHKKANIYAYLVALVGSISYAFYITMPLSWSFKEEIREK